MHLHTKSMEATTQIAILKQRELTKEAVENRITQLLDERRCLLQQITEAYREEAKKINESQSELHIDIAFMGDREGFRTDMIQRLKGTAITQSQYQQLSEKFDDYASMISDWILRDGKDLQAILRPAAYVKLVERLTAEYPELLQCQTEDSVQILYHNKPLKQHSMGQRASALILFILTQEENDVLIIDQPEDDLDTKVIYDELIQTIRKRKRISSLFLPPTMPISQSWATLKRSSRQFLRMTQSRHPRVILTNRKPRNRSSTSWRAVRKPSIVANRFMPLGLSKNIDISHPCTKQVMSHCRDITCFLVTMRQRL